MFDEHAYRLGRAVLMSNDDWSAFDYSLGNVNTSLREKQEQCFPFKKPFF